MTAIVAQPTPLPSGGVLAPPVNTPDSQKTQQSRPPSPSRAIPTDFRSSVAAWWSSNGYRDARVAEERLLRRLSYFTPQPETPSKGGWFSFASAPAPSDSAPVPPTNPSETGLVASLRSVFIPTPDPDMAPKRPDQLPESPSSSVSSLEKKRRRLTLNSKCHDGELVDYINTLEISRPDLENSKEAVVVLHGYAAAFGFFFRNWDSIANSAASTGRRTFFLDWLGMGVSSRPSPSLLASPTGAPVEARVARAEHFFLSSLESWRESVGLERLVLVGHSLGGYLASAYALRYPDRVSSLILVSPAGIPHGPDTPPTGLGPRGQTGPGGKEWKDGKPVETSSSRASLDAAADAAEMEMHDPRSDAEMARAQQHQASLVRRSLTKAFLWGWEKGLSPFSILRGLGPWGPLLVGKYSSRRFASQDPADIRDLHSYIYATSILKGSGEFCISHILAPGAYARMPIVDRIHKLRMPVTFLYGDGDWMDVEGGRMSQRILAKEGNTDVKTYVVPNAGHHLYLDNPSFTNRVLDQRIKSAPPALD